MMLPKNKRYFNVNTYSTVMLIIFVFILIVLIIVLIKKSNAEILKLKNSSNVNAYENFNKKIENSSIINLIYTNILYPPVQITKDIWTQLVK